MGKARHAAGVARDSSATLAFAGVARGGKQCPGVGSVGVLRAKSTCLSRLTPTRALLRWGFSMAATPVLRDHPCDEETRPFNCSVTLTSKRCRVSQTGRNRGTVGHMLCYTHTEHGDRASHARGPWGSPLSGWATVRDHSCKQASVLPSHNSMLGTESSQQGRCTAPQEYRCILQQARRRRRAQHPASSYCRNCTPDARALMARFSRSRCGGGGQGSDNCPASQLCIRHWGARK